VTLAANSYSHKGNAERGSRSECKVIEANGRAEKEI
jgi:hypothetical protein